MTRKFFSSDRLMRSICLLMVAYSGRAAPGLQPRGVRSAVNKPSQPGSYSRCPVLWYIITVCDRTTKRAGDEHPARFVVALSIASRTAHEQVADRRPLRFGIPCRCHGRPLARLFGRGGAGGG